MHRLLHALLVMACLPFAGCDVSIKIDEDEGVQIKAPGVDIKVSDDEGLDIKAPGVDIEVSDDQGVDVNAPEVDVEFSDDQGVDAKASGVEPLVNQKGTAMPSHLLAQQTVKYDLSKLLDPEILVFLVPIVAIIAVAAVKTTTAVIRHRERMEKLRLGIDPDDPSPEGNEISDPYKTTSQHDS